MLNEQSRTTDPETRQPNVVVTSQPALSIVREETTPSATRVEVNPGGNTLARNPPVEPGAPLRTSAEGIRQQRYAVGKTIDLCWYILGVLEVVLAARIFFELTAANSAAGFVKFIFGISGPFAWPFNGIFPIPRDGNNAFDTNIIIAMVVYAIVAWGITRLLAMTIERPSVT
jgi:hypothetical protein